jgi:hypothetical protein
MENQISEEKIFSTSDLNLASFLKCQNMEIADVKKDGSKTTFLFKDIPERKQLTIDFYNDHNCISAKKLLGALRDLKSITFNVK